jgi:hypothetical protein
LHLWDLRELVPLKGKNKYVRIEIFGPFSSYFSDTVPYTTLDLISSHHFSFHHISSYHIFFSSIPYYTISPLPHLSSPVLSTPHLSPPHLLSPLLSSPTTCRGIRSPCYSTHLTLPSATEYPDDKKGKYCKSREHELERCEMYLF